jgi:DNA-binding NarL/FixJ family response regulator
MIVHMTTSVMLIDDDPSFRGLARRMFSMLGLSVVGEADSCATGLASTAELHPQAILVDVGLPDGNGIELAHRLTALPWRPRVVLTSVDPYAATPDDVRWSGAAGFAPKDQLPGAGVRLLLAPA